MVAIKIRRIVAWLLVSSYPNGFGRGGVETWPSGQPIFSYGRNDDARGKEDAMFQPRGQPAWLASLSGDIIEPKTMRRQSPVNGRASGRAATNCDNMVNLTNNGIGANGIGGVCLPVCVFELL